MSAPKPINTNTPTVREIIAEWLQEHGFDGLYSEDCCACQLSDLMPCVGATDDCKPGYTSPCTCGQDCEFHINATKPEGGTP